MGSPCWVFGDARVCGLDVGIHARSNNTARHIVMGVYPIHGLYWLVRWPSGQVLLSEGVETCVND